MYVAKTTKPGRFTTNPGWWSTTQRGFADRTVQEGVPRDHHDSECRDDPQRQPHQGRKRDHRPPQRPNDDEHRHLVIEVELETQTADDRELQKDGQPDAACQQELRQLWNRLPSERKERARSRQQKEDWCTDVSDPACQEERGSGLGKVCGTDARFAKIISIVIERHQDHHDTAQGVDRREASRQGDRGSHGPPYSGRPRGLTITKLCISISLALTRPASRGSSEDGDTAPSPRLRRATLRAFASPKLTVRSRRFNQVTMDDVRPAAVGCWRGECAAEP